MIEGPLMNAASNGAQTLSQRVQSLRLPDKAIEPKAFPIVPWSLCFALGVLCVILGIAAFRPRSAESAAPAQTQTGDRTGDASFAPAPAVAPGGAGLVSKGYIIPVHQIQVSPKVGGMVVELFIEEGKHVKEGDVLAKIETVEYQSDFDRVDAQTRAAKHRYEELTKYRDLEIRQAKADVDDAVAQRDSALKEYRRNYELVSTRAVSPKDLEAAESQYRSTEARLVRNKLALDMWMKGPRDERIAMALAEHQQYAAERDKAKWRLDNTTVKAPVSGTILTKKAEKGNMVNPSAFSNGLSASLCDMADLSDMEVDLAIAERDIGKVAKGQKCKVVAEAFPKREYAGVVSRIMPQADRAKGAVPVRVKIAIPQEEEGQFLRPDMGAIVTFLAGNGPKR
jgi:HlyD family secretion protein